MRANDTTRPVQIMSASFKIDYQVASVRAYADASQLTLTNIGTISAPGGASTYNLALVAGRTYVFSSRGSGATPLADPALALSLGSGSSLDRDDDGGENSTALLTFTPSTSETYTVTATGSEGATGNFTLEVREASGLDTVANTVPAADASLSPNSVTFGFLETPGDVDVYRFEVRAGLVYTIGLAGGADATTDRSNFPAGELNTIVGIVDEAGNLIASNDDMETDDPSSRVAFQAAKDGIHYVVAAATNSHEIAGYSLSLTQTSLEGLSPLQTIDLGTKLASNNISVYFVPAGETLLDTKSLGWSSYEISRALAALDEWARISPLNIVRADSIENATFKLLTTETDKYLGAFLPPGDGNAGVGLFARNGAGWNDTGGLERGGYGYTTLVHEFGHGLGLAHPHDNGGGSPVMPGVAGTRGTYGVFNLNQTLYTIMSYNDGWQLHPEAASGLPATESGYGNPATPGALDIAVFQQKYGMGRLAEGDSTYVLPAANGVGAFYQTIYDSSGVDTIRHDGGLAANIDLRSATLDYSSTGGGLVSHATGVFGGYTIAAGVFIENAVGGDGDDRLNGNAGDNLLTGRGGDDLLAGGGGADTLIGGSGDDAYVVASSRATIVEITGEGNDSAVIESGFYQLGANALVELLSAQPGTAAINIIGNGSSQAIIGNFGDNIINGFGGFDTMIGLAGNDQYLVRSQDDQVIETDGGGADTVYTMSDYNVGENEVEILSTVLHVDTIRIDLIGNFGTQMIVGNYGDNVLNGGSGGIDTLIGLRGDDIYAVGSSRVDVIENAGEGSDTVVTSVDYGLDAGMSVEVLAAQNRSGTAAINLFGNELDQTIAGNDGVNYIDGGAGADVLIGGGGADTFAFTAALGGGNVDAIADFMVGTDRIGLLNSIFSVGTAGVTASHFVVGTAALDVDGRLLYNAADGKVFYDADGVGVGAAIEFAMITPGIALTLASFDVLVPAPMV